MDFDLLALERIEREAWLQIAAAAPGALAQDIGLVCEPIDGTLFMMARRIPAFQFNWLSGAGVRSDDSEAVGRAIARFRDAGQTKFIIQIPPGPYADRVASRAESDGLVVHSLAWAKFNRETSDPPKADSSLNVREVNPDEADLFGAAAIAGFGMPAPLSQWLREIVGRPGWRCFVGFLDGAPAAAGALFVEGEYGWLGIGSTKAEARKRGLHSSLLARRVEAANRDGARWVVTETGIPQPGELAQSYKNILAADFKIAYVRPNWAPSG